VSRSEIARRHLGEGGKRRGEEGKGEGEGVWEREIGEEEENGGR